MEDRYQSTGDSDSYLNYMNSNGSSDNGYGELADAPPDDYQYETPEDVYNFGRMRIRQQMSSLRAIGAAPVAKNADYISALGGQLKGWRHYNAAKDQAQSQYQQRMTLYRRNLRDLEERYKYQFPITDIV